MKTRNVFLALSLFMGMSFAASAQSSEMPKYQRSSLHMILLTTDESALNGATDFSQDILDSWKGYPFPDKYNQHTIDFVSGYGGAPKGSLMEIINEFSGKLDNIGVNEAKNLIDKISNGKEYKQQLIDRTKEIIETEKLGNKLIAKWFNIKEDGSYDMDLLLERANYNASQSDVNAASATVRGLEGIADSAYDLIGNTFITFSKLNFYESEPIAAFTRDLALVVAAALPGPAQTAGVAAAEAAYGATKNGFIANTTTLLYKLDWNEEIQATFEAMFTADGSKIDMAKFNEANFTMSLIDCDSANSATIDAVGGLSETFGNGEKAKPDELLIKQTICRNVDKILAKMAKNNEEFAPVSQIVSVNPLKADMGMKEGLSGGESFNLLQPVMDTKTNKVEWKSIGVVKVDKKGVWDNRISLVDQKKEGEGEEVQGTVLSANKKAAVGMVVKQVVKKK